MTAYLLDANVVSEIRKPKPHGAVVTWLGAIPDSQLFVSAVTIGELQAGVERTRLQDLQKALEIERWVDELVASYAILPMDAPCFREWARLMRGKPEELLEDMMIAATARIHHLAVATRNLRDFAGIDLQLLNPFEKK